MSLRAAFWDSLVGLPAGYTGLIAPGYGPAGDARLIEYVDDKHPAVVFSAGWDESVDSIHYQGSTHFQGGVGPVNTLYSRLTYYGGGFQPYSISYYGFCPSEVYDNGKLVGQIAYNQEGPNGETTTLHLHRPLILPKGLHQLEFRPTTNNPTNSIALHDGIRLLPHP